MRKGITICYIDENITEPILIISSINYLKIDEALDWDIWYLYFEGKENIGIEKEYYEAKPERKWMSPGAIKDAKIYAINLVDITNEEDIKNKIFKRLIEM